MPHTPGPWSGDLQNAVTAAGNTIGVACLEAPGPFWGDIYPVTNTEEMTANARLIAAAPDLLDALERLDSYLDFGDPLEAGEYGFAKTEGVNSAFAAARAVIAKAKGAKP